LTQAPKENGENKYVGEAENFVFSLDPALVQYKSTQKNDNYLLCHPTYLTIGQGGDGPAIRLNEDFKCCKSYSCDTYGSLCLTGKEGFRCEEFDVMEMELHLI